MLHNCHHIISLFSADQRSGRTKKIGLLLGPVRRGTRATPTNDRLPPRPPPAGGRPSPCNVCRRHHDEAQLLPLPQHSREVVRVRKVHFSTSDDVRIVSCTFGNSVFSVFPNCNESSAFNPSGNSIPDCQSKLVILRFTLILKKAKHFKLHSLTIYANTVEAAFVVTFCINQLITTANINSFIKNDL